MPKSYEKAVTETCEKNKGLISPSLRAHLTHLRKEFIYVLRRQQSREVEIRVEHSDLIPVGTMANDVSKVEHLLYSPLQAIICLGNTPRPRSLPCSVHLYQSLIPNRLGGDRDDLF